MSDLRRNIEAIVRKHLPELYSDKLNQLFRYLQSAATQTQTVDSS